MKKIEIEQGLFVHSCETEPKPARPALRGPVAIAVSLALGAKTKQWYATQTGRSYDAPTHFSEWMIHFWEGADGREPSQHISIFGHSFPCKYDGNTIKIEIDERLWEVFKTFQARLDTEPDLGWMPPDRRGPLEVPAELRHLLPRSSEPQPPPPLPPEVPPSPPPPAEPRLYVPQKLLERLVAGDAAAKAEAGRLLAAK